MFFLCDSCRTYIQDASVYDNCENCDCEMCEECYLADPLCPDCTGRPLKEFPEDHQL